MNIEIINQIISNSEMQLSKFSKMTVECSTQLLGGAIFLAGNTEILKNQLLNLIKDEDYIINLCNEIISLSDTQKHKRELEKYKRDIQIHEKNKKHFQDILLRIGYL